MKVSTCMKAMCSFGTQTVVGHPLHRHSELGSQLRSEGLNCRQVTPHLGYLTNWHSRIQSVQHSLSNTLSEGPDHQTWLWREIKKKQAKQRRSTTLFFWYVRPYLPACRALTSSSSSSAARVRRCSPLTVMTPCQDGPFDYWAVALQRGSQNKEDNCKVCAQEICGNEVSTCHSCETLLKAHTSSDNGSLKYGQKFLICLSFVELMRVYCCTQKQQNCIFRFLPPALLPLYYQFQQGINLKSAMCFNDILTDGRRVSLPSSEFGLDSLCDKTFMRLSQRLLYVFPSISIKHPGRRLSPLAGRATKCTYLCILVLQQTAEVQLTLRTSQWKGK